MLKNKLFASALLMLSMATSAWAEKADRDKPMQIEADNLRYDDLKQYSIFTGKVVGNKGTIQIRGARVEVTQDPEGYQYGTIYAEPGGRAFFRQKREGLNEYIEGEGEVIYYDGKADKVTFTRRAEMRRLRGSSLADETRGALIVWDNTSETYTVDGVLPGGTGGGRISAMLTPKPNPLTSASQPAAASSAPVLRKSTTLGGTKK